MAAIIPPRPRIPGRRGRVFALVESEYNANFVHALADRTLRELKEIEPSGEVERFNCPGAFEIPLVCKLLAAKRQYSAIIGLAIILRGETTHADLIAATVSNSLMQISLDYSVPVIHEVLLLDNEEQARERCMGENINRGVEAARAAVKAANTLEQILEDL